MPAKKKIQGKVQMVSVKVGVDQYRQSTAIAALRGETVSEVVRAYIDDYIARYRDLISPTALLNTGGDDPRGTDDDNI